ncbi:MAG: class I SAM-dependent methyltransferase [Steroidobacteraceae bacterium]
MDATQRLARERDFHNQRFTDESQRESRVRRFYDAIAYGFAAFRDRAATAAAGKRVLEYGCGSEILAFDLARDATEVIGIDISEVAIQHARASAIKRGIGNVTFNVDNAERLHVPDASIDLVVGSGIVHHLDIEQAMHEVRRVLRPGGQAIFAEPLGHNPAVNWYRRRTPELRTPDEHPLLQRDLRTMAEGFTSMQVTYFGLIAPVLGLLPTNPHPTQAVTKWVWSLDRALCSVPLLQRYAWFSITELQI